MVSNADFLETVITKSINNVLYGSRERIDAMKAALDKAKESLKDVDSIVTNWKNERDSSGVIQEAASVVEGMELRDDIKKWVGMLESKIELEDATCEFIAVLSDETRLLRARIAQLEKNIDDIPYTLWRVVLAMRARGMTDKQIAERLYDKGQGLSRSQLGALLYTGREEMPASITLQVHGAKFFDKPDADSA